MESEVVNSGVNSRWKSLIAPLVIGLVVGIVGWLLNLFLQRYFIEPVFCRSTDSFAVCSNGGNVAWAIAHIVLAGLSIIVMVRYLVFRPLLVAVAALLSVWGVAAWLSQMPWYSAIAWQAILFAFAYALFAWIARNDKFWQATLVSAIVVVICRLAINLA